MESQKVCCCSVRTWVQIIAIIQISSNIGHFILLLLEFSARTFAPDLVEVNSPEIVAQLLPTILFLLTTVLGMVLGVILLKGVQDGNCDKLRSWMIFTSIGIAIYFLMLMNKGMEGGDGFKYNQLFNTEAVTIIVGIGVNLVFMAIVNIHRRELEGVPKTNPRVQHQLSFPPILPTVVVDKAEKF